MYSLDIGGKDLILTACSVHGHIKVVIPTLPAFLAQIAFRIATIISHSSFKSWHDKHTAFTATASGSKYSAQCKTFSLICNSGFHLSVWLRTVYISFTGFLLMRYLCSRRQEAVQSACLSVTFSYQTNINKH